jgi:glycosyltransferase involved in cell wall biosynthesis
MESSALIAICCNSFPPEGGGAANRIYNLAILLRDAGYRVQVVCAMPNYPTGRIFPAYRRKLVVNEVVDDIHVRRVWLSPSNTASAWARGWSVASFVLSLKLLAFRRILAMKPSLVIVSSPPLPMAAAAVRYFKQHGCKVLLNVSDIWPLSAHALGALEQSGLYRRLEHVARRMYRSADAVTAQSIETLAHIAQHCNPMPPSMLYRNLPRMALTDYSANAPYTSKVRIIYPGVLGHAQGLLALCSNVDFSSLNGELHIYGEGPELPDIRSFINAHPGRGIFLHKPIPAAALPGLLREAHAVLVPLVAPIEGALPSKLFTAMQAGVPVLYSGGGEGAGIVAQYQLGWVADPGDYPAIAKQIAALSAMHSDDLSRWRIQIHEAARRHFNKEVQDERLLTFIASVMDGK